MHWLSYKWFIFWWPSDKGNGPENVQWTVLALIVASLLIPRVRKFFSNHMKAIHEKLDHHHEEMLRQAEDHHVKQMDLAKKHHVEHLLALQEKPKAKRDSNGRFTN